MWRLGNCLNPSRVATEGSESARSGPTQLSTLFSLSGITMFFSHRSRHRARTLASVVLIASLGLGAWYWFGTDRTLEPWRFLVGVAGGLLLAAALESASTYVLGSVEQGNGYLKRWFAIALVGGVLLAIAFIGR